MTGEGYFWPRWVWFGVVTALTAEFLLRRALRIPGSRRRWLEIDASVVALLSAIDTSL